MSLGVMFLILGISLGAFTIILRCIIPFFKLCWLSNQTEEIQETHENIERFEELSEKNEEKENISDDDTELPVYNELYPTFSKT